MASKNSPSAASKGARVRVRQARAAAARQAIERAARRQRRQRWLLTGIGVALVAAIAVTIGVVLGTHRTSSPAVTAVPSAPRTTADGRTAPPPWPAPTDPTSRVRDAGLPMLGEEGSVEHIHAHLDVLVDGQQIQVPAGIGVSEASGRISPLHTHDGSGVVHIESPVKASFSLGQLFTEWQVSLAADHIGGLRAGDGKLLRAYVNGKPVEGDPAAIILGAHDEIAIVYGSGERQANPPATYAFANGE